MDADPLARSYALLERLVFGGALQRARVAFLDTVVGPGKNRALLVGDGDGRFLAALLQHAPTLTIDYLEPSGKMIAQARKRVPAADTARVRFHKVEIQDFPRPEVPYDLVATHFFLDCFAPPELESVIAQLASMIAPGGDWLLADFRLPGPGTNPLLRLRARLLLRVMYLFFRLTTGLKTRNLTDPAPALEAQGLILRTRQRSSGDFLASEHWHSVPQVRAALWGRGIETPAGSNRPTSRFGGIWSA